MTDLTDKKDNIITLSIARAAYDKKKCKHLHFLIDEEHQEVTCGDCEMKLNPMWVLTQLARSETRFVRENQIRKETIAKLEAKRRTKCQHCQKMTRVRV